MGRQPLFDDDEPDEAPLVPARAALDGEIDLTSLIDVVFQLLIFFMVASSMRGTPDVDMPAARYATGVATKSAVVVTIRRAGLGGPPMILLGDGIGPETTIDGVKAYLEQGSQAGHDHVIIKAERDIPTGLVQQVAKLVGEVPGMHFNIGVQEKR